MTGRLLTISGVDCSGKSTQVSLLVRALEQRGVSVRRVWYRPGYSAELDLARQIVRRIRPTALPTPNDARRREVAFARPTVRRSWLALAGADTVLQLGAKLRAQLLAGRWVVCDRYIADAALDLRLRFPTEPWIEPVVALTRLVCPNPDVSFLLNLPEAVMFARADSKNEPFRETRAAARVRHQRYQRLAEGNGLVVLDATGTPEEVHAMLWQRVEHYL